MPRAMSGGGGGDVWYQLATKYGKLADSILDPWGGLRDVSRLAQTAPDDVRSVFDQR